MLVFRNPFNLFPVSLWNFALHTFSVSLSVVVSLILAFFSKRPSPIFAAPTFFHELSLSASAALACCAPTTRSRATRSTPSSALAAAATAPAAAANRNPPSRVRPIRRQRRTTTRRMHSKTEARRMRTLPVALRAMSSYYCLWRCLSNILFNRIL